MTAHRSLLVTAPLLATLACGYGNMNQNIDDHPMFDAGVAATIIMPGQQAPPMQPYGSAYPGAYGSVPPGAYPPGTYPPGSAPPGAPLGPAGQAYGAPSAPPGGYTSFGGAQTDRVGTVQRKSRPSFFKYLAWPFAAVLYPFKKVGDWIAGDPDMPQPQVQQGSSQGMSMGTPGASAWVPPTREQVQAQQEQARLNELERQLAMGAPVAPPPVSSAPPPEAALSAPSGRGTSIAEELLALRRTRDARAGKPGAIQSATRLEPAKPSVPPAPRGVADKVEDRDGNDRPDYWAFREGGRLVREVIDTNGDGQPDRAVFYDDAGQIARIEDDTNHDGKPDAWEEQKAGQVVRRRADTNGDGSLDSWSFFEHGEIARQERDTDGDGFRDRLDLYAQGKLQREEEDATRDGRPDRVTWYDAGGQVMQRDEDSDGDGMVDVRSHYEGGRLARRELLTPEALSALERGPQAPPDAAGSGEDVGGRSSFRE
jgi:hypothetical protein